MPTTPEPAVSPAPDTEALRPLIEAAVKQGIKDWDRDYDSRATGPITNYVLGALDYTLRAREAGLRADLDRARAEVERLKREGSPGVMHKVDQAFHDLAIKERDLERARVDRLDGALRSTQQGLIRMEQQRDALRVAICRAAGVDPDEISEVDTDYEAMLAELAGARPIPDDAAEQVHAAVLGVAYSWPTLADSVTRQVMRTLQSWQTPKLAALFSKPDPWATPTTGPAPAAADVTAPYCELLGAIWLYVKWHYVTKQLTTEQKELWADAVDAFAEPQEGKAERWWRAPAASQDPAEPAEEHR